MKRLVFSIAFLIVSNSFSMHSMRTFAPRSFQQLSRIHTAQASQAFSYGLNISESSLTPEDRKKQLSKLTKTAILAGSRGILSGSVAVGGAGLSAVSALGAGVELLGASVQMSCATGVFIGVITTCLPWPVGLLAVGMSHDGYCGAKEEIIDFKRAMGERKELLEMIEKTNQ